jgi:RNA polymerase sigma-70 factor (ECF subfamily)
VEADDLVQEAIVSALQSHETIDFSKYEPFSWLCQLAERRLIDAHRRFFETQKRGQGEDVALEGGAADGGGGLIQLLIAGVTSPSKAFSRNQKEIALAESLNQLPEEQRKALIWRYVEGLDGKAIGERLGKSDGAVRIMIMRAMERLREILATNDLFKNDSSLFDRGRN